MSKLRLRVIAPYWSFASYMGRSREEYKLSQEVFKAIGVEISLPNRIDEKNFKEAPTPFYEDVSLVLADIEEAIDDPNIHGLISLTGGNAPRPELLSSLPYDKFPERFVVVGFSQVTELMSAFQLKTNCVTVLAADVLMIGGLCISGLREGADQMLDRLSLALSNSPYTIDTSRESVSIVAGNSEGIVIGGNLEAFIQMPPDYRPSLKSKILLVEPAYANLTKVRANLNALKRIEGFGELAGLVIGYAETEDVMRNRGRLRNDPESPYLEDEIEQAQLVAILRELLNCEFPVAYGFDFGHVFPTDPIRLNTTARLISSDESCTLEFAEMNS